MFSDLGGVWPTGCVFTLAWLTISWRSSRWVSMSTRLVRMVSSFCSASAQCTRCVSILWWARSSSPCTCSSSLCSSLSHRLLTRPSRWMTSSRAALAVLWQKVKWGVLAEPQSRLGGLGLSRKECWDWLAMSAMGTVKAVLKPSEP